MTHINLDNDALTTAVSTSIVQQLTPEKRLELIQAAIKDVISKPSGNSYSSVPPIQQMFNDAVHRVIREMVVEQLAKDETFMTNVRQLLADGVQKLFEGERRTKAVEAIASALESAMTERSRY